METGVSGGTWVECSSTCGGGIRMRYRVCNNPAPENGGSPCAGLNYDTMPCSTSQCPGRCYNYVCIFFFLHALT